MNPKQIISSLVLIQIILLILSFGVLSNFEREQSIFEKSIIITSDTKQLSGFLIFETEKYLGGVPYSEPKKIIESIYSNMDTIKNGGIINDETRLNPLPEKFYILHDIILEKLEIYVTHLNNIENLADIIHKHDNTKFLVLETERFDTEGAFNVLINSMIKENNQITNFIITLNYVLAIFNVGIHIVMIFVILRILQKQKEKELKLEKLSAIGELSARLAHDLLNPLNILQGVIELIKYSKDRVFSQKHEDRAFRAINQMSHHILDVMNFIRTQELIITKNSILQIIDESINRVPLPETILFEKPEKDFEILCDAIKLEVVLSNLISNSIDAMKSHGTIKIFAQDTQNDVEIKIEDPGTGITDDVFHDIFEPLVTTKLKGTGLGLASCKTIVSAHGGRIYAENNPTTFTIILPKTLEVS